MEIESVHTLANSIADSLGIYNSCDSTPEARVKGKCKYRKSERCCRTNFLLHLENRIYSAVENERLISQEAEKIIPA